MANSEKTAAVAEITESFRGATAALLTEYRGLSVSEITQLRRALGSGTQYAVVKNTLTKIAAAEAGVTGLDELLSGPTAIAFVSGDPVEAAKGLRDFAKAHPMLVVKGGVLDGNPLSAAEIAKLADLESREVLLAKLAGAMKGTLSQAVGLFAAPLSQAARVFGALEAKAQADPSVLAGGAGAPTEPAAVAAPEATDATEATGATESAEAVVAEAIAPQPETEAAPAAEVATDETPAAPAAVESSEPAEEIVAEAIAPQPEPDAPASEPDPADAPASEGETE